MLELFCGTAGVTACFKRSGFHNAVAVDKTRHKGALAGVVSLDMTRQQDQRLVSQWLEHWNTQLSKQFFLLPLVAHLALQGI